MQEPGQAENPLDANPHDATVLLARVGAGDSAAAHELLPLVYEQLRAMAGSYFRGQPSDHTLQPTALVHEAYLKLVHVPDGNWEDRMHFCAVAATAMRQILHDRARRRRAAKRGGDAKLLRTPVNVREPGARRREYEFPHPAGLAEDELRRTGLVPACLRGEWRQHRAVPVIAAYCEFRIAQLPQGFAQLPEGRNDWVGLYLP